MPWQYGIIPQKKLLLHFNFVVMKKLLFIVIPIAVLFLSCNNGSTDLGGSIVTNPASADGTSGSMPVIQFNEDIHDFGRIIAGEKVTYNFKFKNTGNADLLISKVSTSCGCTAPEYPTTPIAAGKEGFITVSFNSENRKGFQHKTITVLSNTNPNTTVLQIKATVFQPEQN